MKVAISTIGKFHSFDLARQMHARGALAGIFSGYPRFKLTNEGLPTNLVHTHPYLQTPFLAFARKEIFGSRFVLQWEYVSKVSFDNFVAGHLPECDVFVGLSGSALRSGKTARRNGARYVCDRGSAHIRYQDRLLREEHARWGLPFDGIDSRVIAQEEAEYCEADRITVPSSFALDSFVREGVTENKLHKLPYGVSLTQFQPTSAPAQDRFDVLFVGGVTLQKGVPYLLQAFAKVEHRRKSLTFAGRVDRSVIAAMKKAGLNIEDATFLGHVPQPILKDLMSRMHVLVLPSIQEGMALVQAQAMACGCIVVATEHTGARDLFTDRKEGYIVPIRDPQAIAERLQLLADDPVLRDEMSKHALERVRRLGGWQTYGDSAIRIYREAIDGDQAVTSYSGRSEDRVAAPQTEP